LTLCDIIEIASNRNLDTLVRQMQWEVENELSTSEALKLLPSLVAEGERSHRSNSNASRSRLATSKVLGPASIDVAQTTKKWDLTMTWNILDFGVTYFRSLAQEDRAATLYFQYARAKQNLILDIYKSYWKAIGAKWGYDASKQVLEMAKDFQGKFEKQADAKIISQIQGLKAEDQLLSLQLRFYNYQEEYEAAKAELAALMGMPADICFELEELSPFDLPTPPEISDVCELEEIALESRPELYEGDFNEKLSRNEARQAILLMLPTVSFFASQFHDSDKYLVHHNWFQGGVRAAWNLLLLPSRGNDIRAAKTRVNTARTQRLAISVGVISQLHISLWKYQEILEQFNLINQVSSVRQKLLKATELEYQVGEFNEVELLNAKADALQGTISLIQSFGDLQIALEQINNSIGQPLFFNNLDDLCSIEEKDEKDAE
jgi:outer membrane protein TolC